MAVATGVALGASVGRAAAEVVAPAIGSVAADSVVAAADWLLVPSSDDRKDLRRQRRRRRMLDCLAIPQPTTDADCGAPDFVYDVSKAKASCDGLQCVVAGPGSADHATCCIKSTASGTCADKDGPGPLAWRRGVCRGVEAEGSRVRGRGVGAACVTIRVRRSHTASRIQ